MPVEANGRKTVTSQFFPTQAGSSSSSSKKQRGSAPLDKQTSIISLSSSDGVEVDDDIQFIEDKSVAQSRGVTSSILSNSKKRKSAPSISNGSNNTEVHEKNQNGMVSLNGRIDAAQSNNKKPKVAALFERAKNGGKLSTLVKSEETGASLQKLQQWKFAGDPQSEGQNKTERTSSPPVAPTKISNAVSTSNTPSSSPLPEVGPDRKTREVIAARRAKVRKMLLGIDTNWRKSALDADDTGSNKENAEDRLDESAEENDSEGPVASTSKSVQSGTSSHFAKFAANASAKTTNGDVQDKKAGKKGKAKGKGKERAVQLEPDVKYTPLEQQVLDIKAKYPDTLLIVEVGYKFKFFGEDAKVAARELNIACFMSQNFYTAMIPAHRVQVHVRRLISSGYKVGIVRQRETAALKKVGDNRNAPFTRELTDLYTASTYVEGLDDDKLTTAAPTSGTILCLCEESTGGKGSDEKVVIGLVSAQPSTGEVIYDEFEDGFLRAELETRLLHIQPGELVLQGPISPPTKRIIMYLLSQDLASGSGQGRLTDSRLRLSSNDAIAIITKFYTEAASDALQSEAPPSKGKSQEAPKSPDVIDLSSDEVSGGEALATVLGLPSRVIIALAGLMQHLTEFKLESIFVRPQYFVPFAQRGHMLLNANTIANLEIFSNQTDHKTTGSLFSILDHTKTLFGRRLLRHWVSRPLLQKPALQERINAVDEIIESHSYLLGKLRGLLRGLPDLERGLARIHYGKSSPQELLRVLQAFQRIGDEFPSLPLDLSQSNVGFKSSMINEAFYALPKVKPVVQEFLSIINAPKAREGLKTDLWVEEHEPEEITDCKDLLDTVDAEFMDHLKECRKILKKPAAQYISVAQEEYLLEIRISEAKVVPDDWIRINGTKTVYRFRSPRMQALLHEREQATEKLAAEADFAYAKLLNAISAKYDGFRDAIVKLATLDCLISLATVGLSQGYVKPTLVEERCLRIKAGRHPVVETVTDMPFIPNDIEFSSESLQAMVITGCNMSGKSSVSRMVALLVIMTQIGCRIPCDAATIGIVDYIGTRFGASDEIARGRSTFMVELTETCEIIKAATARSLVVLDELGRGTSTNDGLAIAHSVLKYLVRNVKCNTLFITHFPQLAQVAQAYPQQCQLFQMAYREETGIDRVPDITFLYKLIPGLTDRVHGVACARMAGVPESVCQLAANKSQQLEESDLALQTRKRAAKAQRLLRWLAREPNAADPTLVVRTATTIQL